MELGTSFLGLIGCLPGGYFNLIVFCFEEHELTLLALLLLECWRLWFELGRSPLFRAERRAFLTSGFRMWAFRT